MPTATPEMRKKWGGQQGVGEDKAMGFLESRGYTLRKDWHWDKPSSDHEPTKEEWEAAWFLITEWDFGDIIHQTGVEGET